MASSSLKRARDDENVPPQHDGFVQYVHLEKPEQQPKPKRQYRRTIVLTDEIRRQNQEAYDRAAPERERLAAEAAAQAKKDIAAAKLAMVKGALDGIKGAGFDTLWSFFQALFTSKDQHVSAWISGVCRDHGVELHSFIHLRQPKASEEWACKQLSGILEKEARRLTDVFKPPPGSTVSDILESFSMDGLLEQAKTAAPMLFLSLSTLTGFDESSDGRKDKDVVLGTVFAILAQCRNERASHFQTVLCVYLLACGATRSLFEVLNHAGLSLSYDAAIRKLKSLAFENLEELCRLAKEKKFMIVWDNINIAFRVGQQRTDNKDHFDNGTTSTFIPVFGAARGDNPLDHLPSRTTRKITFDYHPTALLPSTTAILEVEEMQLWHIREILLDAYPDLRAQFKDADLSPPSVDSIPLHKTKQYPLPAAFIDESTIDGTLDIIDHILFRTLGMSEADIKEHGVILAHGDQLTVSLIETASGSRRDDKKLVDNPSRFLKPQLGLFHAKMAGTRCTVNQHWGTPNSKALWSLWRMSMLLGRKAMSVGWNAKQEPPFRPSMELMIDLVLPANILDGFRLHCGRDDGNLNAWVKSIRSLSSIRTVAKKILENNCSARRVSKLRSLPPIDRDLVHENITLFNRDALLLLILRAAVKHGDIGSVVNILSYWMVMFRGTGKMPKYADMLYNTLMQLKLLTPSDK
ncbi:hypothetical protein NMY22_g8150 [Coprinellus aureogranulatus]|nr:hypothetical protein NMY22_g8150 [Coprinellus aureogranulatus]